MPRMSDYDELDEAASAWREQVDTAVAGDDLATQFEAFLRDPWK